MWELRLAHILVVLISLIGTVECQSEQLTNSCDVDGYRHCLVTLFEGTISATANSSSHETLCSTEEFSSLRSCVEDYLMECSSAANSAMTSVIRSYVTLLQTVKENICQQDIQMADCGLEKAKSCLQNFAVVLSQNRLAGVCRQTEITLSCTEEVLETCEDLPRYAVSMVTSQIHLTSDTICSHDSCNTEIARQCLSDARETLAYPVTITTGSVLVCSKLHAALLCFGNRTFSCEIGDVPNDMMSQYSYIYQFVSVTCGTTAEQDQILNIPQELLSSFFLASMTFNPWTNSKSICRLFNETLLLSVNDGDVMSMYTSNLLAWQHSMELNLIIYGDYCIPYQSLNCDWLDDFNTGAVCNLQEAENCLDPVFVSWLALRAITQNQGWETVCQAASTMFSCLNYYTSGCSSFEGMFHLNDTYWTLMNIVGDHCPAHTMPSCDLDIPRCQADQAITHCMKEADTNICQHKTDIYRCFQNLTLSCTSIQSVSAQLQLDWLLRSCDFNQTVIADDYLFGVSECKLQLAYNIYSGVRQSSDFTFVLCTALGVHDDCLSEQMAPHLAVFYGQKYSEFLGQIQQAYCSNNQMGIGQNLGEQEVTDGCDIESASMKVAFRLQQLYSLHFGAVGNWMHVCNNILDVENEIQSATRNCPEQRQEVFRDAAVFLHETYVTFCSRLHHNLIPTTCDIQAIQTCVYDFGTYLSMAALQSDHCGYLEDAFQCLYDKAQNCDTEIQENIAAEVKIMYSMMGTITCPRMPWCETGNTSIPWMAAICNSKETCDINWFECIQWNDANQICDNGTEVTSCIEQKLTGCDDLHHAFVIPMVMQFQQTNLSCEITPQIPVSSNPVYSSLTQCSQVIVNTHDYSKSAICSIIGQYLQCVSDILSQSALPVVWQGVLDNNLLMLQKRWYMDCEISGSDNFITWNQEMMAEGQACHESALFCHQELTILAMSGILLPLSERHGTLCSGAWTSAQCVQFNVGACADNFQHLLNSAQWLLEGLEEMGVCSNTAGIARECDPDTAMECIANLGLLLVEHLQGDSDQDICSALSVKALCVDKATTSCNTFTRTQILNTFTEVSTIVKQVCSPAPPMSAPVCVSEGETTLCDLEQALICMVPVQAKMLHVNSTLDDVCRSVSGMKSCIERHTASCDGTSQALVQRRLMMLTNRLNDQCPQIYCEMCQARACLADLYAKMQYHREDICMDIAQAKQCIYDHAHHCSAEVGESLVLELATLTGEQGHICEVNLPSCLQTFSMSAMQIMNQIPSAKGDHSVDDQTLQRVCMEAKVAYNCIGYHLTNMETVKAELINSTLNAVGDVLIRQCQGPSLHCYTCNNQISNEDCNRMGVQACSIDMQMCATVVEGGIIRKGCISPSMCRSGCVGNTCSACCTGDMCNQPANTVITELETCQPQNAVWCASQLMSVLLQNDSLDCSILSEAADCMSDHTYSCMSDAVVNLGQHVRGLMSSPLVSHCGTGQSACHCGHCTSMVLLSVVSGPHYDMGEYCRVISSLYNQTLSEMHAPMCSRNDIQSSVFNLRLADYMLQGVCSMQQTQIDCFCYGMTYRYHNGTSFTAVDGCNSCFCQNGIIGCSCNYNGHQYYHGSHFWAGDGCNTCYCYYGDIACTFMDCPQETIDQCPVLEEGMSGICVEECNSDWDCTGNTVCCFNGCGHTCHAPEIQGGDHCHYGDKVYATGESFLADDGCNTCFCGNGMIGCTLMACQPHTTECSYHGQNYHSGSQFMATDGCNFCFCYHGNVGCTTMTCPTPEDSWCYHGNNSYWSGQTFMADDNCNVCYCVDGYTSCTRMTCPEDGGICRYGNQTFQSGSTFMATDGCNQCICGNGIVGCTKMMCPNTFSCSYGNKQYESGDIFMATDGCNTCFCQDGAVGCTMMLCPTNDTRPQPHYDFCDIVGIHHCIEDAALPYHVDMATGSDASYICMSARDMLRCIHPRVGACPMNMLEIIRSAVWWNLAHVDQFCDVQHIVETYLEHNMTKGDNTNVNQADFSQCHIERAFECLRVSRNDGDICSIHQQMIDCVQNSTAMCLSTERIPVLYDLKQKLSPIEDICHFEMTQPDDDPLYTVSHCVMQFATNISTGMSSSSTMLGICRHAAGLQHCLDTSQLSPLATVYRGMMSNGLSLLLTLCQDQDNGWEGPDLTCHHCHDAGSTEDCDRQDLITCDGIQGMCSAVIQLDTITGAMLVNKGCAETDWCQAWTGCDASLQTCVYCCWGNRCNAGTNTSSSAPPPSTPPPDTTPPPESDECIAYLDQFSGPLITQMVTLMNYNFLPLNRRQFLCRNSASQFSSMSENLYLHCSPQTWGEVQKAIDWLSDWTSMLCPGDQMDPDKCMNAIHCVEYLMTYTEPDMFCRDANRSVTCLESHIPYCSVPYQISIHHTSMLLGDMIHTVCDTEMLIPGGREPPCVDMTSRNMSSARCDPERVLYCAHGMEHALSNPFLSHTEFCSLTKRAIHCVKQNSYSCSQEVSSALNHNIMTIVQQAGDQCPDIWCPVSDHCRVDTAVQCLSSLEQAIMMLESGYHDLDICGNTTATYHCVMNATEDCHPEDQQMAAQWFYKLAHHLYPVCHQPPKNTTACLESLELDLVSLDQFDHMFVDHAIEIFTWYLKNNSIQINMTSSRGETSTPEPDGLVLLYGIVLPGVNAFAANTTAKNASRPGGTANRTDTNSPPANGTSSTGDRNATSESMRRWMMSGMNGTASQNYTGNHNGTRGYNSDFELMELLALLGHNMAYLDSVFDDNVMGIYMSQKLQVCGEIHQAWDCVHRAIHQQSEEKQYILDVIVEPIMTSVKRQCQDQTQCYSCDELDSDEQCNHQPTSSCGHLQMCHARYSNGHVTKGCRPIWSCEEKCRQSQEPCYCCQGNLCNKEMVMQHGDCNMGSALKCAINMMSFIMRNHTDLEQHVRWQLYREARCITENTQGCMGEEAVQLHDAARKVQSLLETADCSDSYGPAYCNIPALNNLMAVIKSPYHTPESACRIFNATLETHLELEKARACKPEDLEKTRSLLRLVYSRLQRDCPNPSVQRLYQSNLTRCDNSRASHNTTAGNSTNTERNQMRNQTAASSPQNCTTTMEPWSANQMKECSVTRAVERCLYPLLNLTHVQRCSLQRVNWLIECIHNVTSGCSSVQAANLLIPLQHHINLCGISLNSTVTNRSLVYPDDHFRAPVTCLNRLSNNTFDFFVNAQYILGCMNQTLGELYPPYRMFIKGIMGKISSMVDGYRSIDDSKPIANTSCMLPVECKNDPCLSLDIQTECPRYPWAVCRASNCSCEPNFYFNNVNVTDFCQEQHSCDLGMLTTMGEFSFLLLVTMDLHSLADTEYFCHNFSLIETLIAEAQQCLPGYREPIGYSLSWLHDAAISVCSTIQTGDACAMPSCNISTTTDVLATVVPYLMGNRNNDEWTCSKLESIISKLECVLYNCSMQEISNMPLNVNFTLSLVQERCPELIESLYCKTNMPHLTLSSFMDGWFNESHNATNSIGTVQGSNPTAINRTASNMTCNVEGAEMCMFSVSFPARNNTDYCQAMNATVDQLRWCVARNVHSCSNSSLMSITDYYRNTSILREAAVICRTDFLSNFFSTESSRDICHVKLPECSLSRAHTCIQHLNASSHTCGNLTSVAHCIAMATAGCNDLQRFPVTYVLKQLVGYKNISHECLRNLANITDGPFSGVLQCVDTFLANTTQYLSQNQFCSEGVYTLLEGLNICLGSKMMADDFPATLKHMLGYMVQDPGVMNDMCRDTEEDMASMDNDSRTCDVQTATLCLNSFSVNVLLSVTLTSEGKRNLCHSQETSLRCLKAASIGCSKARIEAFTTIHHVIGLLLQLSGTCSPHPQVCMAQEAVHCVSRLGQAVSHYRIFSDRSRVCRQLSETKDCVKKTLIKCDEYTQKSVLQTLEPISCRAHTICPMEIEDTTMKTAPSCIDPVDLNMHEDGPCDPQEAMKCLLDFHNQRNDPLLDRQRMCLLYSQSVQCAFYHLKNCRNNMVSQMVNGYLIMTAEFMEHVCPTRIKPHCDQEPEPGCDLYQAEAVCMPQAKSPEMQCLLISEKKQCLNFYTGGCSPGVRSYMYARWRQATYRSSVTGIPDCDTLQQCVYNFNYYSDWFDDHVTAPMLAGESTVNQTVMQHIPDICKAKEEAFRCISSRVNELPEDVGMVTYMLFDKYNNLFSEGCAALMGFTSSCSQCDEHCTSCYYSSASHVTKIQHLLLSFLPLQSYMGNQSGIHDNHYDNRNNQSMGNETSANTNNAMVNQTNRNTSGNMDNYTDMNEFKSGYIAAYFCSQYSSTMDGFSYFTSGWSNCKNDTEEWWWHYQFQQSLATMYHRYCVNPCNLTAAQGCLDDYLASFANNTDEDVCGLYDSAVQCLNETLINCDEGLLDLYMADLVNNFTTLGAVCYTIPNLMLSTASEVMVLSEGAQSVDISMAKSPLSGCQGNYCEVEISVSIEGSLSSCRNGPSSPRLLTRTCAHVFTPENWDIDQSITLVPRVDHLLETSHNSTVMLKASIYAEDGTVVAGEQLRSIGVVVMDTDSKSFCSIGDIHVNTFDGLYYSNFLQGEFVLYQHRTLPFKVHIGLTYCPSMISCTCIVMIQSGDDVFIIDKCRRKRGFRQPQELTVYQNQELSSGTKIYVAQNGQAFQVVFPHGTVVFVKTARYTLDVWVKPSPFDLDNTLGFCGTYDNNLENDLTLANNTVFNLTSVPTWTGAVSGKNIYLPVNFTNQWRAEESLFGGVTDDPDMPSFQTTACDCVQSECIPTPIVETCHIVQGEDITPALDRFSQSVGLPDRRKRQTDTGLWGEVDWDNSLQTQLPSWPTPSGYTEATARAFCEENIVDTALGAACSSVVNLEDEVITCMTNILVSDSTNTTTDIVENLKTTCRTTVLSDTSVSYNTNQTYEDFVVYLLTLTCPFDCSGNGFCIENQCQCDSEFVGPDCSLRVDTPPTVISLSFNLFEASEDSVTVQITVIGDGFLSSDNLMCHYDEVQIDNNGYELTGASSSSKATFLTFTTVLCELTGSLPLSAVLVSVSNNGQDQSTGLLHIIQDPVCYNCDPAAGICNTEPTSCVVDGACYGAGTYNPTDPCYICNPVTNDFQYKPSAICTESTTSSTTNGTPTSTDATPTSTNTTTSTSEGTPSVTPSSTEATPSVTPSSTEATPSVTPSSTEATPVTPSSTEVTPSVSPSSSSSSVPSTTTPNANQGSTEDQNATDNNDQQDGTETMTVVIVVAVALAVVVLAGVVCLAVRSKRNVAQPPANGLQHKQEVPHIEEGPHLHPDGQPNPAFTDVVYDNAQRPSRCAPFNTEGLDGESAFVGSAGSHSSGPDDGLYTVNMDMFEDPNQSESPGLARKTEPQPSTSAESVEPAESVVVIDDYHHDDDLSADYSTVDKTYMQTPPPERQTYDNAVYKLDESLPPQPEEGDQNPAPDYDVASTHM